MSPVPLEELHAARTSCHEAALLATSISEVLATPTTDAHYWVPELFRRGIVERLTVRVMRALTARHEGSVLAVRRELAASASMGATRAHSPQVSPPSPPPPGLTGDLNDGTDSGPSPEGRPVDECDELVEAYTRMMRLLTDGLKQRDTAVAPYTESLLEVLVMLTTGQEREPWKQPLADRAPGGAGDGPAAWAEPLPEAVALDGEGTERRWSMGIEASGTATPCDGLPLLTSADRWPLEATRLATGVAPACAGRPRPGVFRRLSHFSEALLAVVRPLAAAVLGEAGTGRFAYDAVRDYLSELDSHTGRRLYLHPAATAGGWRPEAGQQALPPAWPPRGASFYGHLLLGADRAADIMAQCHGFCSANEMLDSPSLSFTMTASATGPSASPPPTLASPLSLTAPPPTSTADKALAYTPLKRRGIRASASPLGRSFEEHARATAAAKGKLVAGRRPPLLGPGGAAAAGGVTVPIRSSLSLSLMIKSPSPQIASIQEAAQLTCTPNALLPATGPATLLGSTAGGPAASPPPAPVGASSTPVVAGRPVRLMVGLRHFTHLLAQASMANDRAACYPPSSGPLSAVLQEDAAALGLAVPYPSASGGAVDLPPAPLAPATLGAHAYGRLSDVVRLVAALRVPHMVLPLLAHPHDHVSQAALVFLAALLTALRVLLPGCGLCGEPLHACGVVARPAGRAVEHPCVGWGLLHILKEALVKMEHGVASAEEVFRLGASVACELMAFSPIAVQSLVDCGVVGLLLQTCEQNPARWAAIVEALRRAMPAVCPAVASCGRRGSARLIRGLFLSPSYLTSLTGGLDLHMPRCSPAQLVAQAAWIQQAASASPDFVERAVGFAQSLATYGAHMRCMATAGDLRTGGADRAARIEGRTREGALVASAAAKCFSALWALHATSPPECGAPAASVVALESLARAAPLFLQAALVAPVGDGLVAPGAAGTGGWAADEERSLDEPEGPLAATIASCSQAAACMDTWADPSQAAMARRALPTPATAPGSEDEGLPHPLP
ncbi:hypothetical protein PAPYR_2752 [Paratrimastix pyriformis]|uniref:Uncharacterized protein n=1 Tax=Paratrimastix pyriformis TaxID=342808 RepID=A0ABQ8UU67_9EUKA|nr:hypothetical protein PAPYR_2752 [Paratrimastix pyriformis]